MSLLKLPQCSFIAMNEHDDDCDNEQGAPVKVDKLKKFSCGDKGGLKFKKKLNKKFKKTKVRLKF